MPRLKVPIEEEWMGAGRPCVTVRFDFGDDPTIPLRAVVDTGAICVVAPMYLVKPDRAAKIKMGVPFPITGIAGETLGYWAPATLLVGQNRPPLEVRDIEVALLPAPEDKKPKEIVLLGQRFFFERIRLVQLAVGHESSRHFILDDEWQRESDRGAG